MDHEREQRERLADDQDDERRNLSEQRFIEYRDRKAAEKRKEAEKSKRTVVASVTTGFRWVMGTEWPIENQLMKAGKDWLVILGLCNGIPLSSIIFRTKGDAVNYWEELGHGTTRRQGGV
jgi:hypothetical protein